MIQAANTPLMTKDQVNAEALDRPRISKPALRGYENTPTLDLLAAMLIGEAESEDLDTMRALASVVPNRVADDPNDYGANWRQVLLNPGQFYGLSAMTARKRIQNAFAEGTEPYQNARRAAFEALSGKLRVPQEIRGALFFDTSEHSHPKYKMLGKVGKFYFYGGKK